MEAESIAHSLLIQLQFRKFGRPISTHIPREVTPAIKEKHIHTLGGAATATHPLGERTRQPMLELAKSAHRSERYPQPGEDPPTSDGGSPAKNGPPYQQIARQRQIAGTIGLEKGIDVIEKVPSHSVIIRELPPDV